MRGRGERGTGDDRVERGPDRLEYAQRHLREDIRSLKSLSETYSAAAQDIVSILDSASTVSTTVVNHQVIWTTCC